MWPQVRPELLRPPAESRKSIANLTCNNSHPKTCPCRGVDNYTGEERHRGPTFVTSARRRCLLALLACLGFLLQGDGERGPDAGGEGECVAVAVGGVAHADQLVAAGGL